MKDQESLGGTLNSRRALLVGFLPQTSGHVLLLVAAVHLGLEHLVLLDVVVRPLVLGSGRWVVSGLTISYFLS